MKLQLPQGSKITVYDSRQVELGEGTLKRIDHQVERSLTVYECEEHVILAKGEHYVKIAGKIHHVK